MSDEIEAWFDAAGPRGEQLRRVDALVTAAAPGIDRQLVPVGSSAMLGYGLMPYQPKSAKEPTMWPLITLAAQKRHLSLYVCAVVDGSYLAESRAERLGKVSCGKSCIRRARRPRARCGRRDRGGRQRVLGCVTSATPTENSGGDLRPWPGDLRQATVLQHDIGRLVGWLSGERPLPLQRQSYGRTVHDVGTPAYRP